MELFNKTKAFYLWLTIWIATAFIIWTLASHLISAASDIKVLLGILLSFVFGMVSFMTKCFTSFSERGVDESGLRRRKRNRRR